MRNGYYQITEQESLTLGHLLTEAIVSFIENNTVVYLERIGLLIPKLRHENVVRRNQDSFLVRLETSSTINFEKCNELTTYHYRRYGEVAELRELVKKIMPHLPVQMPWNENTLRGALRTFFKQLLEEIITYGCSNALRELGTFYAIHNCRGDNFRDRFAGADILFDTRYDRLMNVGKSKEYVPPILKSAWEPLRYAYGDPLALYNISVQEELEKMGFSVNGVELPVIKTAVFERKLSPGKQAFFYCTEGVRECVFNKKPAGVEFVFQLANDDPEALIPTWPSRVIALGIVLLSGSKTGTISAGVGLNCRMPLNGKPNCNLTAILATTLYQMQQSAYSKSGEFNYINLVGITDAEVTLMNELSDTALLAILKYKSYDQVTNIDRLCTLRDTNIGEKVEFEGDSVVEYRAVV